LVFSTKNVPFVIRITTKLQKKRNMFEEENDKSTRLTATAWSNLKQHRDSLGSKKVTFFGTPQPETTGTTRQTNYAKSP
jgi:3D (Asp-Asp-Asp) domain-containing protein